MAKHISYQHIFNEETISLNLLNKLPEKTKEIEEFIYFEALSSHTASKKTGEKLFEFANELLWTSLHFWQPSAMTLKSVDRDACQVHINSFGINRRTRL